MLIYLKEPWRLAVARCQAWLCIDLLKPLFVYTEEVDVHSLVLGKYSEIAERLQFLSDNEGVLADVVTSGGNLVPGLFPPRPQPHSPVHTHILQCVKRPESGRDLSLNEHRLELQAPQRA